MAIFLVPVVLIGGGALASAGGVILGGQGAADLKRARDSLKQSEATYSSAVATVDAAVQRSNQRLQLYGEQQEQSLNDVVLRMGDFLRRNAQKVRESERLLVDGVDVTVGSVAASARLDVDAVAWIRGVVGSAAAGVGVSTTVTGAVGTLGVASTGAAISGLSGAAAESATLAFLGGGSLASGGGGVALGATALNAAIAGPVILAGGFVVKSQGDKARTKAEEYGAKVAVTVAKMSETCTRLETIDLRIEELSDLLAGLTTRAKKALDLLESETFQPELHADRFQRSLNFAMAVRDVAATPVVDGAGDLNDKTSTFEVKYRSMAGGAEDA